MEPIFNEDEQNEILDIVLPFLPKEQKKLSQVDQKYDTDVAKVLSLLSACVVTPDGEGRASVDYIIKDQDYRTELEGYVMNLTRKNLNKKIEVNKTGILK